MAEKILNTRIQLKYDTYTNWVASNLILKKGEVAIATIETGSTQNVNSVNPPQVLIKVGDGVNTYSALPFVSALAADVYAWAKKSEAEFKTYLDGLFAAGSELTKSTVDGVQTISHEAKLGTSYSGTQTAGKAEVAGDSITIKVPKLTVNTYGHITSAQDVEYKVAIPATVEDQDHIAVVEAGAKLDVSSSTTDKTTTYTISHETVATPTKTTGSGREYLTGVTTDDYGHITGFTTANEVDQDLSNYKTKQTKVSATGAEDKTLVISQNENGEISAKEKSIKIANTQVTGLGTASTHDHNEYAAASELDAAEARISTNETAIAQNASDINLRVLQSTYATDKAALEAADTTNLTAAKAYADGLAKNYDAAGSAAAAESAAKAYADDLKESILGEGISETFDTLKEIQDWINGAGVNATELSAAIAEEAAARAAADEGLSQRIDDLDLGVGAITTGTENGTIAVDGTNVAVKGLQDAAYTTVTSLNTTAKGYADTSEAAAKTYADGLASNYATSAQGGKADTAVQSATFAGKAFTKTNTALSISQADARDALGLGSAAYVATSAFDAAGAATAAKNEVIGASGDTSSANTIYGVKKYTDEKVAGIDTGVHSVSLATGTSNGTVKLTIDGTVSDNIAVKGLKSAAYTESSEYATAAQGEKADTALQEITTTTNGGLMVTNGNQVDIDISVTFVFDCGNASGENLNPTPAANIEF